ncbi:MAG TPA: efflux RND transporter periplasmic adaptor subunit [Polyangia bacterium]
MRRLKILLACVALLGACPERQERRRAMTEPPLTELWLWQDQVTAAKLVVEPLSPQPVGGLVVTSGRVTFDDLKVAHVISPVTGRVVRIEAQPGQRVKKGDTLAVIESPDLGSVFSDLQKAHAEFTNAEKDFKRQKELFDVHAGSQRDLETAQGNFSKSKAELDRAKKKAQLLGNGKAGQGTQSYTLRAPIAGEVVARNVNPGAEVQGQYTGGSVIELFTIGELDTVWVMADVFEMDVGRVKQGTECIVKVVAYPNRTFKGIADWVSDTLDATTRTAKVRCKLDNPDRDLKPEMYATASLAVDRKRELALPRSSLMHLGDQTMVFIELGKAPDGRVRFERRPVSVSEELGGDYLPVIRGIAAGERVVTVGAVLLSGML